MHLYVHLWSAGGNFNSASGYERKREEVLFGQISSKVKHFPGLFIMTSVILYVSKGVL